MRWTVILPLNGGAMKKQLFVLMVLFATGFCFTGCTLTRSPFADVHKLGTVVAPGHNITIPGTNGPVTIEYVAPTTRRITLNGESREICLYKSSLLNGIYKDRAKLQPTAIGQIKDVDYLEATAVLKSQDEADHFVKMCMGYGYTHIPEKQMLLYLEVRKYFNVGIKSWSPEYLVVMIRKYKIDEKNGHPHPIGEHPQQTIAIQVSAPSSRSF